MNIKELAEQAGWSGLYTTYNEPTGEANWEMVKENITVPVTTKQIERFAELVAAAEREQCAKHYLGIMRDAVEQAVLRERESCAKLFQPTYPRPCDCVVCDCGNKADAQYIAEWDVHATIAKSIRARGDKHD